MFCWGTSFVFPPIGIFGWRQRHRWHIVILSVSNLQIRDVFFPITNLGVSYICALFRNERCMDAIVAHVFIILIICSSVCLWSTPLWYKTILVFVSGFYFDRRTCATDPQQCTKLFQIVCTSLWSQSWTVGRWTS
jgi:hypothetical protein